MIVYPYLNPMFWFGYWGLGRTLGHKISSFTLDRKYMRSVIFIALLTGSILWVFGKSFISYFSVLSTVFEFSMIFVMASYVFDSRRSSFLQLSQVGSSSLFVYLSHNVVIGFFNTLGKGILIWDICKPFIVIIIYCFALSFIKKFLWDYSWVENVGKNFGVKLWRRLDYGSSSCIYYSFKL